MMDLDNLKQGDRVLIDIATNGDEPVTAWFDIHDQTARKGFVNLVTEEGHVFVVKKELIKKIERNIFPPTPTEKPDDKCGNCGFVRDSHDHIRDWKCPEGGLYFRAWLEALPVQKFEGSDDHWSTDTFEPIPDTRYWFRNFESTKWVRRKFIGMENGMFVAKVAGGFNEFAFISELGPIQEKPKEEKPDCLGEGEELWDYCEKYKQYKDPLHVDGTLEEYQLSSAEGLIFIGFAVSDGCGMRVMNSPHWFTDNEGFLSTCRNNSYKHKAKIHGAVMKKVNNE